MKLNIRTWKQTIIVGTNEEWCFLFTPVMMTHIKGLQFFKRGFALLHYRPSLKLQNTAVVWNKFDNESIVNISTKILFTVLSNALNWLVLIGNVNISCHCLVCIFCSFSMNRLSFKEKLSSHCAQLFNRCVVATSGSDYWTIAAISPWFIWELLKVIACSCGEFLDWFLRNSLCILQCQHNPWNDIVYPWYEFWSIYRLSFSCIQSSHTYLLMQTCHKYK